MTYPRLTLTLVTLVLALTASHHALTSPPKDNTPSDAAFELAEQDDYYYELTADLESGEITETEFNAQVIELAEWRAKAQAGAL